jgi:hypothetical protein
MSLKHVTLGERIVMAARLATAEHLRQEADEAGINVKRLQNQMAVIRLNAQERVDLVDQTIRQDLYRQPNRAVKARSGGEAA